MISMRFITSGIDKSLNFNCNLKRFYFSQRKALQESDLIYLGNQRPFRVDAQLEAIAGGFYMLIDVVANKTRKIPSVNELHDSINSIKSEISRVFKKHEKSRVKLYSDSLKNQDEMVKWMFNQVSFVHAIAPLLCPYDWDKIVKFHKKAMSNQPKSHFVLRPSSIPYERFICDALSSPYLLSKPSGNHLSYIPNSNIDELDKNYSFEIRNITMKQYYDIQAQRNHVHNSQQLQDIKALAESSEAKSIFVETVILKSSMKNQTKILDFIRDYRFYGHRAETISVKSAWIPYYSKFADGYISTEKLDPEILQNILSELNSIDGVYVWHNMPGYSPWLPNEQLAEDVDNFQLDLNAYS